MLQSLEIKNFKRFGHLRFPVLKRANLIAGKNNTGKTGVLEALLLLLEPREFPQSFPTAFRNSDSVGDKSENVWKWLFRNRETKTPITISCDSLQHQTFTVMMIAGERQTGSTEFGNFGYRISFSPATGKTATTIVARSALPYGAVVLSTRPSDPQNDAVDFDRVVLKSQGEEQIESLLRVLEPRLKSVRSIKPFGASLIYVDVGLKEKIPAFNLGQGFTRLLSIYAETLASGKKILLIDEIESGLHYSVLADIWRGILKLTEQEDVQVFATTHSYECIRAAHIAFSETLGYDFALHRLEEEKGEVQVTTYDKESLEASLANNFEIR